MDLEVYINGDIEDAFNMIGYMKGKLIIKPKDRKNKVIKYLKIKIIFFEDSSFNFNTQLVSSDHERLVIG